MTSVAALRWFFDPVAGKGVKAMVERDPDRVGAGRWTVVMSQKNGR